MARSAIFPMRLDDDTKERWAAAADRDGTPLAEFIREAVEARIERRWPRSSAPSSRSRAKRCSDKYGDHAKAKQEKRGLMCRECGERVFG